LEEAEVFIEMAVPLMAIHSFLSVESLLYQMFRTYLDCATMTSESGTHPWKVQKFSSVCFSLVRMLYR